MIAIYKYELNIDDDIPIKLPKGAKILTVNLQNNNPFIWAEVDVTAELEERSFVMFGTGQSIMPEILAKLNYIGTIFPGPFVFHVYQVVK